MSNPSTNKPTPPAPASGSSSTSTSTPAASKPSSPYEVKAIPPFNYAAAAKKSKPSPAAVTSGDATGYVNGAAVGGSNPNVPAATAIAQAAGGSGANTGAGHSRKQSVRVDGVNVPVSRVESIRGAAASDVAFGTANDKNAVLSSSPAAPPAFNNGAPKAFGTLPAESTSPSAAPATTKPPLNLHAFFTGGGSPSPAPAATPASTSPAPVPAERRSLATYDPQAQPMRSPQPSTSPLPHSASHHSQLSNASAAFVPRQMPPAFVPQQQPQQAGQAFSPSSGFSHLPPPAPYGQAQPYNIPGKGASPQNIPNDNALYGGPGGAPAGQSGPGSRPSSFVGSPVMQARPPQPQQGRPSFGGPGPTSPRMSNVQLPAGQPMMYPQQWQGQNPYAAPYNPYAAYPSYPGAFIPQGTPGGPPPPLTNAGSSTPSTGVHTPKPASTVPPSPSTVHSLAPSTPNAPSFPSYSSPQPQPATLPRHGAAHFTPAGGAPSTPLRALSLAGAAAPEFKPNLDAAPFTPSPRKSAAIKIVNPKEKLAREAKEKAEKEAKEKAEKEAAAAAAPAEAKKEESTVDVDAEKEKAEQAKAAAAEEQKKQAEEEKAKADADVKKADEEAEKKQAEQKQAEEKKAEDEADAKAKAADEKAEAAESAALSLKVSTLEDLKSTATTPDLSAPSTPGEEIAGLKVKSSEAEAVRAEEATLLADEQVAFEQKDPAQALVDARDTLNAAGPSPSGNAAPTTPSSTLPSFLPAKPATDLSRTPSSNAAPAKMASTPTGPSDAAIQSARSITDLASVSYPESAQAPQADLNIGAEPGKYRYDRDFLLQFMTVCTEKPDLLPNLADMGMVDDGAASRGAFGGGRGRGSMGPPAVPSRSASGVGSFGRSTSLGGVGGAFGGMGNFGQQPLGTSEQRFAASLARSTSGAFGGSRGSMSRTTSQSGAMGGAFNAGGGGRIKSERGSKRRSDKPGGEDGRPRPGQHVTGEGFEGATLEARSATGWAPSVIAGAAAADPNAPEVVQRKVKALLNKLTLERFDSISDQILEWANRSINESDGRILRQVIALIFEKATDEATWSEMYAGLCRKLMEKVSPEVRDETVKAQDGTPVAGGALFRKYLLNRCQEDYENGWKNKEAAALAAKNKEADDKAKQAANEAAKKEAEDSGKEPSKEAELLSDEYYAAQKAKRRGLGLVRFIGELYRLQMLTERIMHECIKKLLANTENPEEEDVESLCRLLTTVGKGLDNPKAKQHMDIYFSRMNTIANSSKVSSRVRFMILDVVDLRTARWASKQASAGPKTIAEIHADAQKAAEESARRAASSGGKLPRLGDQLSRPNSRRGQGRDNFGVAQPGADGWTTQPQRPAKAGDLSGFGRIRDSSANISLGPTGAFANRQKAKQEAARPATPSNPFALLSGGGDAAEPAATSSQRPKLQLKPRTKPLEGEEEDEAKDEEGQGEDEDEDDGAIDPNASSMSRQEAERRAKNSVQEWYEIKNIGEAVASIEALPKEFRPLLITAIAEAALVKKADAVNLTRDLFKEVATKSILTKDDLLKAFEPIMKTLIDTAVDAPSAYTYCSSLLMGVGASKEEVEKLTEKMESEEGEEEVEYGKESFWKAYDKVAQPSS
ncbi:hypothetical protein JCM1841_001528 [Sporobolomyces salmonicolor]